MTYQGEAIASGIAGATVTSLSRMPHQAQPEPADLPSSDRPEPEPALKPVTRRGRLALAPYDADQLELETAHGRIELLGPYGTEAHEGDEVEVIGLPDPTSQHGNALPALLILQMRRLT